MSNYRGTLLGNCAGMTLSPKTQSQAAQKDSEARRVMKRAKSRALRAKSENPLRFVLSPLPVSTLQRDD
jgi:hypothetical protein